MKPRTIDYLNRKKAQHAMQHPTDLKSFLIAEYEASRNIIVKKDVLKMIEQLDSSPASAPVNEQAATS